MHGAVSLCFPLHPPSGSTGTGRGWLEEGEKTGSEICVLEQAFPRESLSVPFHERGIPHALATKAGLQNGRP